MTTIPPTKVIYFYILKKKYFTKSQSSLPLNTNKNISSCQLTYVPSNFLGDMLCTCSSRKRNIRPRKWMSNQTIWCYKLRQVLQTASNFQSMYDHQPLAISSGIWSLSIFMKCHSGGLTFVACNFLSEYLSMSTFCTSAAKI